MQSLKTALKTLLALVVLAILAGLGFVFSGVYNVAATDEHWPVTEWLVHTTVERSVALRADGIEVPSLDGRDMLLEGAASFDAMCSHCHTPPGADPTPVAKGLNPSPPELADEAGEYSAAELFWITKHGLKMTGMPAWGPTHDDAELWPVVAFVRALPDMDGQRYRSLLEAAEERGAGHHAGDDDGASDRNGDSAGNHASSKSGNGTHGHDGAEDHAH